METLASCYFCGAALDKRLQEYPVVPDTLRDGADVPMATLCPACHQKLETVFESVVAAVEDTDTTGDGAGTPDGKADLVADDDVHSSDEMWRSVAEDATSGADDETADEGGVVGEETDEGTAVDEATEDDEITAEEVDALAGDIDSDILDDGDAERTDDGSTASESEEESDEPSDDAVTAEDVDALAGDIDSDILDDDGDAGSQDDDELQSAMQADVPDAFETDSEPPTDDDTATDENGEPSDDAGDDTVTAEDVDELAGDIDADILDDGDADDGESDDEALQSAMQADVPTEFQSGGDSDGDDANGDSGTADSHEAAEQDTDPLADTDDGAGETPAADDADAGEPTDADVDGSATSARTGISALEYNKVMRLLQNRQFPVERDEIETVAANAYDLSHAECAEVIDLAVDRGLIAQEGDQLVRPE